MMQENQPGSRPFQILMIDDDPADVLLTSRFLENGRIVAELKSIQSGEEALRFFDPQSLPAPGGIRPDLVLLDFIMPRVECAEILAALRAHPVFGKVTVAVLTGSEEDESIVRRQAPGADLFLQKPLKFEGLLKVILQTHRFEFELLSPEDLPQKKIS